MHYSGRGRVIFQSLLEFRAKASRIKGHKGRVSSDMGDAEIKVVFRSAKATKAAGTDADFSLEHPFSTLSKKDTTVL